MNKLKTALILCISLFVLVNESNAQIKMFQRYRGRQHRKMGYPDGRSSAGAYGRGGEVYKWGVGAEPVAIQFLDTLKSGINFGASVYGIYNIATKFALELNLTYYFPKTLSTTYPYDFFAPGAEIVSSSTTNIYAADVNSKFTFINENGSDFHIDGVFGFAYNLVEGESKVEYKNFPTGFTVADYSSKFSLYRLYINAGFCGNLKAGPGFLRLSAIMGIPAYESSASSSVATSGTTTGTSPSGSSSFYGYSLFYKVGLGYRLMF